MTPDQRAAIELKLEEVRMKARPDRWNGIKADRYFVGWVESLEWCLTNLPDLLDSRA